MINKCIQFKSNQILLPKVFCRLLLFRLLRYLIKKVIIKFILVYIKSLYLSWLRL